MKTRTIAITAAALITALAVAADAYHQRQLENEHVRCAGFIMGISISPRKRADTGTISIPFDDALRMCAAQKRTYGRSF